MVKAFTYKEYGLAVALHYYSIRKNGCQPVFPAHTLFFVGTGIDHLLIFFVITLLQEDFRFPL